ncbi:MAG: outer membrane beta-barrel protein [Salibacteraceae bacterium]
MRTPLLFTLIFILFLATIADAQRWKRYRHEIYGGAGASNFLGELGGGEQEAQDLFMDFNIQSSRYVLTGGYRFKLNEVVSLRGGLTYARIYGSDEFSGDPHRRSRNLTFRSPVIELAALGEVFFIREKTSNRYRVRGIRGSLGSGLSAYVHGGLAGVYFNPRAEYNGKWYSLQPLGTEGQGLPGGPDKYSRITLALPMGIGAKYSINRNVSLTLEYTFRLTFTDYMDDVSTTYYDPVAIANANGGLGTNDGDAAHYLSNPAIPVEKEDGTEFLAGGVQPWETAQQRGDATTNDSYMFVVLGINYKFTSRKTNRPKF